MHFSEHRVPQGARFFFVKVSGHLLWDQGIKLGHGGFLKKLHRVYFLFSLIKSHLNLQAISSNHQLMLELFAEDHRAPKTSGIAASQKRGHGCLASCKKQTPLNL